MKARYELTDTFSGEANYSWVRRGEGNFKTELGAIRFFKSMLGMTGIPCRKVDMGDTVALYPYGQCVVLFVTFGE